MRATTVFVGAIAAVALGAMTASAQSGQAMTGMDHGATAKGDHKMMAIHDYMAAMKMMDQAMMSAKGSTPASHAR